MAQADKELINESATGNILSYKDLSSKQSLRVNMMIMLAGDNPKRCSFVTWSLLRALLMLEGVVCASREYGIEQNNHPTTDVV